MTHKQSVLSSQQSSKYMPYTSSKKQKELSMYGRMFLQDFCMSFSIILGQGNGHRDFYKVKAKDKKLENLLQYDNYMFLEFDLDKVLTRNLADLLKYGKAYVEVVKWYDKDNNLVGIGLVPFRNSKQIHIGHKFYYFLKRFDGQYVKGKIDDNNVIVFKLKDLGYSKLYFRRFFRRLEKFKLPTIQLALDKKSGFDFDVYTKKEDFKLLKIGHDVRWIGRKTDNYYINEPYFLYLRMKELMLKEEILSKILYMYNEKLGEIGRKYSFEGRICFESRVFNYNELYEELTQGIKNCEQVSDLIYKIR